MQERIEFAPKSESAVKPELDSPIVLAAIERRLIEVNRSLAQGGFRPLRNLFKFPPPWTESVEAVENAGKRIAFDADAKPPVLAITSLAAARVELEVAMPVTPLNAGSGNPEDDCSVQGFPAQGWYDHDSRIVVVQLTFSSARDGCDQPDQWLLKHL